MKSGTFSYLPPMTPQQQRKLVEYVLARGWSPAIDDRVRRSCRLPDDAVPARASVAKCFRGTAPRYGTTRSRNTARRPEPYLRTDHR